MQQFTNAYAGQGVVCTVLDKADNTLIWQCLHAYCVNLRHDLRGEEHAAKVYTPCTEPEENVLLRHAQFVAGQGLPANAASQGTHHTMWATQNCIRHQLACASSLAQPTAA